MKINNFSLCEINICEEEINLIAFNPLTNEIVISINAFTCLKLKVNDEELINIIQSEYLDDIVKQDLILENIKKRCMFNNEDIVSNLNTDLVK